MIRRMSLTPRQLTDDLEKVTRELLITPETDLSHIEQLLDRRASVLVAITACDPGTFSPEDLATLHAIALDGKAKIEDLILLRRKTAGDWHRLNQLRDAKEEPADTSISLRG
jgi:hypothetical protein